jgi:hypothetical protein
MVRIYGRVSVCQLLFPASQLSLVAYLFLYQLNYSSHKTGAERHVFNNIDVDEMK